MRITTLILALSLVTMAVSARSFNNYQREEASAGLATPGLMEDPSSETLADFYFGLILGWQTQQVRRGQCYMDNQNFFRTLNDTYQMILIAFLPANWFNFIDRIRINIDSFSKSLSSCQMHSILVRLERMLTLNGMIETMARLLTQVPFLQGYLDSFYSNLAVGNMTMAGTQLGRFSSAVVGISVN